MTGRGFANDAGAVFDIGAGYGANRVRDGRVMEQSDNDFWAAGLTVVAPEGM